MNSNKKMFFAQNVQQLLKGYGYLYNWYAASHANFAPAGWHVPTDAEWTTLTDYLGGESVAGGKMKETGLDHWITPNTGATNESGFTALPGGARAANGTFSGIGKYGYLWSVTEYDVSNALWRSLSFDSSNVYKGNVLKKLGFVVRLIKDNSTDPGTMTDYDGNIYDTVKIGDQVWTVRNWKCTKLNEGTALTKVTANVTWEAAGAGDYYYCAYNNDESNV